MNTLYNIGKRFFEFSNYMWTIVGIVTMLKWVVNFIANS